MAVLLLLMVVGCAAPGPAGSPAKAVAYVAADDGSLFARHAPVIVPADPTQAFNRVGTPAARLDDRGHEEIYVDPEQPVFFVQRRDFETGGGRYTNLIYRLHFQRVPFPHLTAGRNGGLMIVLTLDREEQLLLVTTVHTCGCYLAMVPTTRLPATAWPEGWNPAGQRVFGIHLPGHLDLPRDGGNGRLAVFLRHATHRVADLRLLEPAALAAYHQVRTPLRPMAALDRLPLRGGGTTSFFHATGPSRGYVKNAFKPLEFLLMSWWVLDPHVGVDKRYGPGTTTGTRFYTSLWPWYRSASDMWEFPDFLRFWGWRFGAED
ncbi:MAG TPA: hypothetical protein ENK48_03235 [Gammaproteobacteria bacterium]|nr:hypothetical protein [Gammaproteobacteria bacterium]